VDVCDTAEPENQARVFNGVGKCRAELKRGTPSRYCIDCGEELSEGRLRAMSGLEVDLCVSCKTERENGRPYRPR